MIWGQTWTRQTEQDPSNSAMIHDIHSKPTTKISTYFYLTPLAQAKANNVILQSSDITDGKINAQYDECKKD